MSVTKYKQSDTLKCPHPDCGAEQEETAVDYCLLGNSEGIWATESCTDCYELFKARLNGGEVDVTIV